MLCSVLFLFSTSSPPHFFSHVASFFSRFTLFSCHSHLVSLFTRVNSSPRRLSCCIVVFLLFSSHHLTSLSNFTQPYLTLPQPPGSGQICPSLRTAGADRAIGCLHCCARWLPGTLRRHPASADSCRVAARSCRAVMLCKWGVQCECCGSITEHWVFVCCMDCSSVLGSLFSRFQLFVCRFEPDGL